MDHRAREPNGNMMQLPFHHKWFHGNITREHAEAMLRPHSEGTFLIRSSIHYQGDYTLSLREREGGSIQHYHIISTGRRPHFTIDEEEYFDDLGALVRHYSNEPDGLCTRLGIPVHRDDSKNNKNVSDGMSHSNHTSRAEDMSNIPPELRIHVDELEIGPEIGRGFFGAVFEGTYRSRKVAIKTLQDPKATRAFMEEAHIMTKLRDPHLVTMIGISSRYIVLEFMAKGNLRDYLRTRGRALISPAMQLNFALNIVQGMVYLESHQFVHRDLASRNILISADDVAKVSDFGMARDDCTPLDGGKIPVKWTAPEAIREKKFTSKSDVWSFGVLLWEMYSFGKVPYPRIPADEVMGFLEEGSRMPKPDDCPDPIYKVMLKCWEWAPAKRPHFADIERQLRPLTAK